MVTEIKSKCYTCHDPNALAYPFWFCWSHLSKALILITEALLITTNCLPAKLDHRSHKQTEKTYTKQTRLQLEQYTNHIKTV